MFERLAYNISAWNRGRKWKIFFQEIQPGANDRVLDIGFTNIEYSQTDNYLEKNYPYQNKITALGIDKNSDNFVKLYPQVKTVLYSGGSFPFEDGQFGIVWSNAVIEHVGGREKQILFLQEMLRVGKKIFFTTPNKFFPVEIHTRVPLLHIILSKNKFDWFLSFINKKWATGDYMNLLGEKDLVALLEKCNVKKYKIIKNRFCGFVMDFVVVIDNNLL
ncbi:MAG: methyltransferase domain-containing protein [Candidatus Magasanikiibacteriota bacterium]